MLLLVISVYQYLYCFCVINNTAIHSWGNRSWDNYTVSSLPKLTEVIGPWNRGQGLQSFRAQMRKPVRQILWWRLCFLPSSGHTLAWVILLRLHQGLFGSTSQAVLSNSGSCCPLRAPCLPQPLERLLDSPLWVPAHGYGQQSGLFKHSTPGKWGRSAWLSLVCSSLFFTQGPATPRCADPCSCRVEAKVLSALRFKSVCFQIP